MSLWRSDPILRRCASGTAVLFGGFLLWGGLAPLAEGVTAFGKIAGESDRQVIQHLEGGIIEEILVTEGARVEAGDTLVVLRDVSATAGRDRIAIDQTDANSTIARLNALARREQVLDLSDVDFSGVTDVVRTDISRRQQDLFNQQSRKLSADLTVLESRRQGLLQRVANQQTEIDGTSEQLAIVRNELAAKRELFAERLIERGEVTSLEREAARLSAELGRLGTARQTDQSEASELSGQIAQVRAEFDAGIAAALVEENTRLSELNQRRAAADDIVGRAVVNAPMAGTILNLRYRTTGGVVSPGDPILEIVPDGEEFVATIEVRPSDIENVYEGLQVRTRLTGLASWLSPTLDGEISRVSADLKTSPNGQYTYYEARIVMRGDDRASLETSVVPGMPVEAFIESGRSRTLLDYIFEPMSTLLRRGVRS